VSERQPASFSEVVEQRFAGRFRPQTSPRFLASCLHFSLLGLAQRWLPIILVGLIESSLEAFFLLPAASQRGKVL
jgi:hypothetical protein